MNRTERKKNYKKNTGRKCICILLMFFLLIGGIWVVDGSFRSMMMIEEPKVFEHNKISEKVHEIYFCGEKVCLDEEKIYDEYKYIKNEVVGFIEVLKEKKKDICK